MEKKIDKKFIRSDGNKLEPFFGTSKTQHTFKEQTIKKRLENKSEISS